MRRLPLLLVTLALLAACVLTGASAAVASNVVRVPNLKGAFVDSAYARLHRDGLKVTIPHGFVLDSLGGGGEIIETSPSAGQQLAVGSTVSLTVGCIDCGLGSPAVPTHRPAYRVPNFVGRPLLVVTRWVNPKILYLTEHFGRLRAATAAGFEQNYRVARQHPAPGGTLALGVGCKISPSSGSFEPTPLVVWLTQSR